MLARLFVALGVASAAATLAVVVIGQPDPPKAKPMTLAVAAPLVPRPVPTETYTRPAVQPAVPARVILASPFAAVAAVEPPKAAALPAPPVEAHPPWAEAPPIIEPKRKRERRADAGGEDNGICARHKLRKVWVSERRWRCRK